MTKRWWRAAAAVLLLCNVAAATPEAEAVEDRAALDAATRDLCRRDVALIGEAASHGVGRTLAFKAALVRRLVDECGYRALFFEAGHYDLLALSRAQRRGEAVTPAMLSSAVGGLWNGDREFAGLLPFLFERMRSGRLALGGLDNNLGSAGAFYSLEAMPAELAAPLPDGRREECRAALRRRIFHDYPADKPYSETERTTLRACVGEMRGAAASDDRGERLSMLANIDRLLDADFRDGPEAAVLRDGAMFLNFRWLAARLPKRTRIIVWGATVHTARDARGSGRFGDGRNLGARLHRLYGSRAFSLAFSAQGGSHRTGRRSPPRAWPTAAPGSLEAAASTAGGTAYLGPDRLARLGALPAALFDDKPVTLRWRDVVDAAVVFREERAPERLR